MGTWDGGMEVAGRGIKEERKDLHQCLYSCRYLLEKPRRLELGDGHGAVADILLCMDCVRCKEGM
jgi:hypothetical protein